MKFTIYIYIINLTLVRN